MTIIKTILIVSSLMLGLIINQTLQAKSSVQTQSNNQSVVFDIQNMTCSLCPVTIRKALQAVDGVQSATVDFVSKTAIVTFDPQKTTIPALIKSTTNVGYPATVRPQK